MRVHSSLQMVAVASHFPVTELWTSEMVLVLRLPHPETFVNVAVRVSGNSSGQQTTNGLQTTSALGLTAVMVVRFVGMIGTFPNAGPFTLNSAANSESKTKSGKFPIGGKTLCGIVGKLTTKRPRTLDPGHGPDLAIFSHKL